MPKGYVIVWGLGGGGGKCLGVRPQVKCQVVCTDFTSLADINECSSQPCLNGGTCHDHVTYYECFCPSGYSGQNCQFG